MAPLPIRILLVIFLLAVGVHAIRTGTLSTEAGPVSSDMARMFGGLFVLLALAAIWMIATSGL